MWLILFSYAFSLVCVNIFYHIGYLRFTLHCSRSFLLVLLMIFYLPFWHNGERVLCPLPVTRTGSPAKCRGRCPVSLYVGLAWDHAYAVPCEFSCKLEDGLQPAHYLLLVGFNITLIWNDSRHLYACFYSNPRVNAIPKGVEIQDNLSEIITRSAQRVILIHSKALTPPLKLCTVEKLSTECVVQTLRSTFLALSVCMLHFKIAPQTIASSLD